MALILLCDQYSRNIFRKTAKAFAFDPISLNIAKDLLEKDLYKEYKLAEKMFLLLPFEHSESMEDQKTSLKLCQDLIAEARDELKVDEETLKFVGMYETFAKKHYDIIEKWGRYPHRNEALGRESTPEEVEYLVTADRFGN